ncbi:MAG: hypothetical protein WB973_20730 [Thermoanaerobaculia bacterium]
MRTLLLAFLLIQAVDAHAQTISAEIDSGPLPSTFLAPFLPAPAVAMAKDRTGIAIAWLMPGTPGDRISVVRLDASGHFAGPVQTIPTVPPSSPNPVNVVAPSLAAAPRGDGFTLAWVEILSTNPAIARAAYCRLDRDLKSSTPESLLGIWQPVTAPAIVRSGKTTWITAAASAWELRDDGSLSEPLNAGMNATDMTLATEFPQIVALGQAPGPLTCPVSCRLPHTFCLCPLVPTTGVNFLQFTSLYSVTASIGLDYDTDAAPAIRGDGHDVAMVWLQGIHPRGGSVVMARLLPPSFSDVGSSVNQPRVIGGFGPDTGATRPDIAGDDERYVVVWRTANTNRTHDIVGASIDRAGNVIPLVIAISAADERDPSVLSMGNGMFLVAYEKLIAGERHIAGRFVIFDSRGRAVR